MSTTRFVTPLAAVSFLPSLIVVLRPLMRVWLALTVGSGAGGLHSLGSMYVKARP